jgi:hypothetical protein
MRIRFFVSRRRDKPRNAACALIQRAAIFLIHDNQ